MVKLLHLMMLLWAMETAPAEAELDESGEEEEPGDSAGDEAASQETATESEDDELTDPRDYLDVKNEHKKMASLQDHINRLHRKAEQQAAYIKQLEEGAKPQPDEGALNAARLETAFMRSAIALGHQSLDLDTAWTLMESKGLLDAVAITDDGGVEGMDDAWSRVLSRYPWLVEEPPLEDVEPATPLRRTASPPRKRTDALAAQTTQARLVERFPELRKHRGR